MINGKAPQNPGFPLHRLNTGQTKVWLNFPKSRPMLASVLSQKYPGSGVGLLSATLRLFVKVMPNGRFMDVPPPWTQFEMWQAANAPDMRSDHMECACRNYYDPEVEGNWSERLKVEPTVGHHPFCQFRDTAAIAYKIMDEKAVRRIESDLSPQERPDEWVNSISLVKGS